MEGNLVLVKLLNFSSCTQQPTQSKIIYLMRTWTIFNNVISPFSSYQWKEKIVSRKISDFLRNFFILYHFASVSHFVCSRKIRKFCQYAKIMSIMLFKGDPWNHKMITFQRVISSHFWLKTFIGTVGVPIYKWRVTLRLQVPIPKKHQGLSFWPENTIEIDCFLGKQNTSASLGPRRSTDAWK